MSLTDAQLALRREGITATDAVILAGCSNWGHPLEVWEQKMGIAPPKPMTLAMAMGHAAEPVVMDLLAEKYGLKLFPGETVRHRVFRHFLATPDRFVGGLPILDRNQCMPARHSCEAVAEGKLVGWQLVKEWFDEDDPTGKTLVFPDSVAVQTQWQMAITYTKKNYVAALLGGWRDDDFHHIVTQHNEELWLGLMETCDRFWVDHVLTKKPPPPDASDRAAEALGRIYPKMARPKLEPVTDDEAAMLRRYVEINAQAKALDTEKTGIANALRYRIADGEGLKGSEHKATWTNQAKTISAAQLIEHYGTTEEQLKTIRDGAEIRVLRVAKLSKKETGYDAAVRDLAAAE